MIRSIVVLIVLTTACTGKQRVDLPSVYGVPGVSRIGFPDPGPVGACPEISGFFELEPEVWQVRKAASRSREVAHKRFTIYCRLPSMTVRHLMLQRRLMSYPSTRCFWNWMW